MLDRPALPRLVPVAAAPLPVAALVVGRPVDEVVALLSRIFNLCAAAQACAVRLALGLVPGGDDRAALRDEILRDHLLRLGVLLPTQLGLAGGSVPPGGPEEQTHALTGGLGVPDTPEAFDALLASGRGVGPLLAHVRARFGAGEAVAARLPVVPAGTWPGAGAFENSVAARQMDHPVMRHIEQTHGRGPLWRLAARLYDIQDCLAGTLPGPQHTACGAASTPAARGTYFVRATVETGKVASFERITPTDHMLAPGGVLAQSLATLPAAQRGQAQVLVDLLDPCSPVTLKEVPQDA